MSDGLSIGEVAARSGVSAKTIRYYEQAGLIEPPRRASNGYRVYDARAVQVLRFVGRARDLGFSLSDVERLLGLWSDRDRTSAEVRAIAGEHLASIEHKIAELQRLRATLLDLVDRCHGDHRPDCPILDDLAYNGDDPWKRRTR